MTKSVIVCTYVTCLCYLLHPLCAGIIHTSKACYGSTLPCTQHHLRCNSTPKIAICDAYYTNNTECDAGISNCVTVNPDNVTEHGYHSFNKSQLSSLCMNCSTKSQCVYSAPRRNAVGTFSVVKYQCFEATEPCSVTCETLERTTERAESTRISQNLVSTKTTDSSINVAGETGSNTGGIVGGVVATVVAVLVVTLVSVWIVRRRRANSEGKEKTKSLPKDTKPDMPYSSAGDLPKINYHQIQDLKSQNSDYDYATADGLVLPPTTNSYSSIEPTGKQTAGNSSKASESEGDYDHLGEKPSPQTSDYDTTASVAPLGHTGEDGYGYNHFQKRTNTQTHQNDYDTAASATKAVAQISTTKRITDEDDYDHFQRGTNAETVSSPYDTTSGIKDNSDYSVAGQMK